MCRSMVVTNNQVGPSGHAPSGSAQFKRDTGSYSPGQWADGISTACLNTLISGNTVTDATDGAIVIFASENVTVTGNTIVSRNRVTMGGINLVDFGPMLLSFVGVVVSNNNFLTDGPQSLIKVGVPIGPMVGFFPQLLFCSLRYLPMPAVLGLVHSLPQLYLVGARRSSSDQQQVHLYQWRLLWLRCGRWICHRLQRLRKHSRWRGLFWR